MDWQTEPHTVDPVIAVAVDKVEHNLPRPRTSITNARDCELAGFNLADVIAAYRMEAR